MITTKFNGSLGLDEIKKVIIRNNYLNSFYEIFLVNDKRKLYVSNLHSFLTDEEIPKAARDLKIGDKIWIDISAFSKDGSLK